MASQLGGQYPAYNNFMNTALSTLLQGVNALLPYFVPETGQLNDPVFGCPTQYSTPYYAWCNAVLAAQHGGSERALFARRARSGLRASLDYLLDLDLPPYPSLFYRASGSLERHNHRDFFWPPVMKTWCLLGEINELDEPLAGNFGGYRRYADGIARVDPLAAFAQRPPSNWAMVWLSGEWLRMRAGLSPFGMGQFDEWLRSYFQGNILLERGFYQEPGHPNSYDLFTRFHLAEVLRAGYDGRWRAEMETLMQTGLRRSLTIQLSDGSLASAHRSTGLTWTDGAQIAFFTHAANFYEQSPGFPQSAGMAEAAREAALRAYHSFQRWQRPDGPYSPAQNLLPPEMRVGYEPYTADGHHSALPLAFLATAIQDGFDPQAAPALRSRPAQAFIEDDPIWRAVLHHGAISLQVNAFPAPQYDAFGITDLTFGPGRLFQFASSVRCLESDQLFNPGLALRPISELPDTGPINPPVGENPTLIGPLQTGDTPSSLRLAARPRGAAYTYTLNASLDDCGVQVREATLGHIAGRSLLIPFLYNPGTGLLTHWRSAPGRLELTLGEESLAVEWTGVAERVVILTQGFENRRGLCALARIDLAEPGDELFYTIKKLK
jgi:hypothetical protein